MSTGWSVGLVVSLLPLACGAGFVGEREAAMAESAGGMPAPAAPPAPGAADEGAMSQSGGAAPAQLAKSGPDATGPLDQRTLLIYEADLHFSVYRVEEGLDTVEKMARELGGHLVERSGVQIVVRVPRQRFEEALARFEGAGEVIRRDVRSFDVTDQHRDLEVRLKNARAVRDRLADLLGRAQSVEDSLKIERELARLTEEIERLTGTLENLAGRVAFSKITVVFEARRAPHAPPPSVRLPFPFLDRMGLSHLFKLSE